MNPSPRFAGDLADAAFDRHVDVFVARLERKKSSLKLSFDRRERVDYCSGVLRADDPLSGEHRDVGARLRDVERPEPYVNV